jgi:uncharacterized protein (TIGR02271 family)
MTDSSVSPYTGRTISEWLDEDIELHDVDGDEVGNVVEINPDFIVAQTNTGFLGLGEPKIWYIPHQYVTRKDDDDWYLSIDKDQLESMNWSGAPADSEWSTDWNEGRLTADEGRGQTRIRRYEEDLEFDKNMREVGEVVVTKNVVEDVKTIEVPIRREEVHVERRPVTDGSTRDDYSTDGAFSSERISVPVMEEDVEVRKVARPVEEIEISKTRSEDTRRVDETVRHEEVDIDDTTDRDGR